VTLTEITEGFTRSTISAKPIGCPTGGNRCHQGEPARRKQRTAGRET
jgi:hypothetical protein